MVPPQVDMVTYGIGTIIGYFFIDFLKSTVSLLTSLPPLVIFMIGLGILYFLRGHPFRISGDFLMGIGTGLAVRGQWV